MNFQKSNFSGGIARMWILPLQYYQGKKFNHSSGLFFALGIKGVLKEIPFSIDKASYSVTKKNSAYNVKISCFIPGISILNIDSAFNLEATPFLIIVEDYNKNFILFGDYDNFFLYDPDFSSNEDYSYPAGINFSISRTMLNMPCLIEDPSSNSKPVASNVTISGDGSVGETLTGQYFFSDDDGDSEENSILKWYLSDDENGTNKVQIATGQTLLVTESNKGKYLQFSVTPNDGYDFGDESFSEYLKILTEDENTIPNTLWDGVDFTDDVIEYKGSGNIITITHLVSGEETRIIYAGKPLIPDFYTKKVKVSFDLKINMPIENFYSIDYYNFLGLYARCFYENDTANAGYGIFERISFDRELVDVWQPREIIVDSSNHYRVADIYYLGFSNRPSTYNCVEGFKIELRINSITYY